MEWGDRLVSALLDALVPLLPLEEFASAQQAASRRRSGGGASASGSLPPRSAAEAAAAAAEARASSLPGGGWSLADELRDLGERPRNRLTLCSKVAVLLGASTHTLRSLTSPIYESFSCTSKV